MDILFPSSPELRGIVDPSFEPEQVAAQAAGFTTRLYSHEAIEAGKKADVVSSISPGHQCLLRGWMMTAQQYQLLESAIQHFGAELTVDAEAYAEAHYLPYSYRHIWPDTAESIWMEGDDEQAAWTLYQEFRNEDALIKDWVKSAKHRWNEACFLPAGTNEASFVQIFRAFRQARGHLFNRGVVFRRFVRLFSKGTDMRGFPLVEEFRLFFFRGTLLAMPDADGADLARGEIDRWTTIARKFRSPFITIDIANLETRSWIVIEAGDGGVSGLPLSIDPGAFYGALANRTSSDTPK